MGRSKTHRRSLVNAIKDKASILKATFSSKRHASLAVVRATNHNVTKLPRDTRISAVLSLGHHSVPSACGCIDALMERLHGTQSASVALKCLFTMHSILTRGSLPFKEQISFYPEFGGRNFLNLSMFLDESDPDTWELSAWVRWYAAVVEHNIMVSRGLGYHLSSPTTTSFHSASGSRKKINSKDVSVRSNSDLLSEMDVLGDFVERTAEFPESSFWLQKNELVYEMVRLVMENYRMAQHEISVRVKELGMRMDGLCLDELTRLVGIFERFESSKGNLGTLFVNRGMNEGFWDLIRETKRKAVEMKGRKEESRLVVVVGKSKSNSIESNRVWNPFADPGQVLWNLSGEVVVGLFPRTVSMAG